VTGMNKSQRQLWEKSLNFTSQQTIYEKFNEELNELEKESKENYFKGFSELKQNMPVHFFLQRIVIDLTLQVLTKLC
jgi:hypothetical protein